MKETTTFMNIPKLILALILIMYRPRGTLSNLARWKVNSSMKNLSSGLHRQNHARCAFTTCLPKHRNLNRMNTGTRQSLHPTRTRTRTTFQLQRPMASLSSSKLNMFQDGERVQVEVDGAQYEGIVQSKKGGWYAVQIQTEDGGGNGDISIVKKRGAQLSAIGTGMVAEKQEAIETKMKSSSNDNDALGRGYTTTNGKGQEQEQQAVPISTIPELLDQTLDAPTIINLDARMLHYDSSTSQDVVRNKRDRMYLEQCKHFAEFDEWVTFTDLHCAPNSLKTSLNVLSKVHAEAKKRNAGVLFLGDFWHHRGTVRVDCLNAVLNALNDWSQPLIMIPGNHDQVSLGGSEHALTPLQNAYRVSSEDDQTKDVPGVLIFSHSTKFREALFVPHIRDIGTMQSILQSKISASSSAVFVHADVTGAHMNDLITSSHGVAPAYFPPSVPIYSGHFHKPHVVERPEAAPGVSIRYVGSPYETTLAEAGQTKALLVLDANQGWECVEEIPLALGRKHWRAKSIDELLELQIMNERNMNDSLVGPFPLVNSGDRVVVSVHQEDLEELRRQAKDAADDRSPGVSMFDAKVKELRSIGASVEIRETKSVPNLSHIKTSTDSMEAQSGDPDWLLVEDMSPFATWSNYLQSEVKREAMKNSTAQVLLKAGNALLDEMGLSETSNERDAHRSNDAAHLSLNDITVEGFGPFKDSVTYPLRDRGLVLLRGSNRDGGSDSNGSGKSTLAMAALWALTGSIDPRPVQDAKVNDVVHDNSKTARATIRGNVNEKEFLIARSKSTSKGTLTFMFDGEDLTKQSAKETQLAIEENIGAGSQILSRTIFHGQHTINGLLEATDAKLKEELSIIVPMKIWRDAATTARKHGRALSQTGSELDGMINIRSRDLDAMETKHDNADHIVAAKGKAFIDMEEEIKRRLEENVSTHDTDEICIENIQKGVNEASKEIQNIENNLNKIVVEMQSELDPMRAILEATRSKLNSETMLLQNIHRQCDRNELSLSSANENLDNLQSRWGVDDTNVLDFDTPSTCPTCKQPMTDDDSHQHLREEIERDISEAMSRVETLTISASEDRTHLSAKQQIISDFENEILSINGNISNRESCWQDAQKQLHLDLQESRNLYSERSNEFAESAKNLEARNELNRLKANSASELKSFKESLTVAIDNRNTIAKEFEEMIEGIRKLEIEREDARSEASVMSSIADNVGGRGVQTFLLQNTVHALQLASQSYLDELSDCTLRLQLVLDAGDRIIRTASVLKSDGSWKTRPLSSLSGGQWRRCSLALSLGFSDLVARRGRLCASLLVLDEPLTHLDSAGRDNVGKLLRKVVQKQATEQLLDGQVRRIGGLSVSTILIILQDLVAEELSESFDSIDEVVKYRGHSKVIVDEQVLL